MIFPRRSEGAPSSEKRQLEPGLPFLFGKIRLPPRKHMRHQVLLFRSRGKLAILFFDHQITRWPNRSISDQCHPCSSVVRFWFSDHPMSRSPDLLQPSACVLQPETPPPIALCCKQRPKYKSTERSTGRSKPFFAFFGGQIWPNFSPVFPFLLFGRQRVATGKAARRCS